MGRVGAWLLGLICALACQDIVGIEDTSLRKPDGDASAGSGGAGGGGGAGGSNGGSAGSGGASASGGSAGGTEDASTDATACDDFSVAQPAPVTLVQGNTIQVDVQLTLGSCFDSTIDVSAQSVNEVSIQPLTLPASTTSASVTVQTEQSTPFGTSVLKLSFSGGGKLHEVDLSVTVKGIPGEPITSFKTFSSSGYVSALAVDTDGDIVVGLNPSGMENGWGVARLTADGNSDTSFTQPSMPNNGGLLDLAVGPGGAIVLVGKVGGSSGTAVMRMNAQGNPDVQLGTNGVYLYPYWQFPSTPTARAVAPTNDGKILTAGGVQTVFMFARVNPTIGTNEKLDALHTLSDEGGYRFVGMAQSRIIVAGTRELPNFQQDVYVRGLLASGSLDNNFGTSGVVQYDVDVSDLVFDGVITQNAIYLVGGISNPVGYAPTLFYLSLDGKTVKHTATDPPSAYNYRYYGAAAQSDGRVIAVGFGGTTASGDYSVVARFNADGSVDTTFGENGFKEFQNGLKLRVVAVAPDDTIVVGGQDSSGAVVFKLWN